MIGVRDWYDNKHYDELFFDKGHLEMLLIVFFYQKWFLILVSFFLNKILKTMLNWFYIQVYSLEN